MFGDIVVGSLTVVCGDDCCVSSATGATAVDNSRRVSTLVEENPSDSGVGEFISSGMVVMSCACEDGGGAG